jgi:hypothetical protein
MYRLALILLIVVVGSCLLEPGGASAQQVQLTNPYQQLRDSFYESFGLGWGASGRGFFFGTGPATSTPPPFGGYDPANDARFGFGGIGGGLSFGFGGLFGTGSTRTNVVESPTIVLPNGGYGGLFSGSQRPFVTGVVPVLGDGVFNGATPGVGSAGPSAVSPLQERLTRLQQGETPGARRAPAPTDPEAVTAARPASAPSGASGGSTAAHGDLSVAEIRRQQAAGDTHRDAEVRERLEKARSYEEAGKPSIAKIYYQQAAARATGELKQQLLDKIKTLGGSPER